jgi:hypothetical protein
MLWTPEHQKALIEYYSCYTATTSAQTRAFIYNHILYLPLLNIVQTCLKSFNKKNLLNDDNQQECMIFTYQLLNKLDPNKLKGALQFIWVSTRRNILNIIYKDMQQPIDVIELDNYGDYKDSPIEATNTSQLISDNSYNADTNIINDEIKKEILNELDSKMHSELIVNKSSTVFLLLLKEYLISNSFDERDFQTYVMDKMSINLSQYRGIASKVKISTLLLNKKF